jgi:hypothetical protein
MLRRAPKADFVSQLASKLAAAGPPPGAYPQQGGAPPQGGGYVSLP